MPYAHWQSSLCSPLWRWRSHWVPPETAESETSSWSPWPSCWAPRRSSAWARSCLLPVVFFSQPSPALCWTLAPDGLGAEPTRQNSPTAWAAAQPPRVSGVQLQESSSTGPVRGMLGDWFWESRSHPAASRWNLLSEPLPQLHPSLPSLSLSCSLRGSPSLSLSPFFFRMQSCTPAVSSSCCLIGSFCSQNWINSTPSLSLSTFYRYFYAAP